MRQPYQSPPWNTTTKAIVAVSALLLAALLLWVFRGLLQQLVLAGLLAYLLHPLITLIDQRTPLRRGTVVLLVYLILALLVLATLSLVGLTTFQQAVDLSRRLPGWFNDAVEQLQTLPERLPEALALGPLSIPTDRILPELPGWDEVLSQLFGYIQPIFSRGGSLAAGVVGATVSVLGQIFLIFIISIYIANDIPRFGGLISDLAHQPGYRRDAERLMAQISQVWAAYLRGQVILGLIIFVVVSVVLGSLGVDNALGLGLLSGAMEFLPVIGPVIGAGAAILVALFQNNPGLGLTPIQFALAVTVAMFLIQQLENNLLVPRIVGDALNLHPLLVMVSVIMGASLAGLLGAVLAAPVVASLRILSGYAWRKMLDLPPFPQEEEDGPAPQHSGGLGGRIRRLFTGGSSADQPAAPQQSQDALPMTNDIYPLSFQPVFKDYIWGGRNLETKLGREIPPGVIAESWEIAAHPNGETVVADGPLAGLTLSAVQDRLGEKLLGRNSRAALADGRFPLLIKLLDANRWLSVQVHPDDDYAQSHGGDLGKTEMWIVLDAEPDAELIFGLKKGTSQTEFKQAVAQGRIEQALHRVAVCAGDAVFVPAGTVHALGPGTIVAEIQQNSDTTYRLYDWGRMGTDGKPRPLHIQQALDVIDWQMAEPGLVQSRFLQAPDGWLREELADCAHFRTERLQGQAGAVWPDECDGSSFQIWATLSGRASLHWDGGPVAMRGIDWRLLPAALGEFTIRAESDCVLVRVSRPGV